MIGDVNGIRMAFSDTGVGTPVVVLVHGFPLNRSMWDPQLGVLRAAGARVIAPDLRGFGASEAGPPGPLTMDQHADDVAGLLDGLGIGEPVVYVGLSMGGYVGFSLWRRHRERVRAFILADTRASADTPQGKQTRAEIAQRSEELNSPQPALDAMLPLFFSPHLLAGSRPEVLVRAMMSSSAVRAVADGARGLADRRESLSSLASIDVPTLVIVGEHDRLTPPAEARLMAEAIPGAQLTLIDQAGHMSNLENPEGFNEALLGFLHL
jgi:pimeloyl-ACP methyl ester carboxylesterase